MEITIQSLGLIVWLISVFILFKFDYIDKMNPSTWDFLSKFDWITFISFGSFFVGIGLFTKHIIRLFSNSKISKFSIKGELELGDNVDKSVFNEHLEEIIYFFERTSYSVVVIEDLDRFETTDIFTKLRELNILLNTSKLIKREINFIYAVKDELFTDKNERVKFFDYIIPVIPFINANNAGVKLNDLIKTRQLEDVLTSDFIQDIVSFIDDIDMRLLINIFHEFCIYRKNISAEIQDNLFAMIVYKNMYPDDFGKLSKREGNLYRFITNKSSYIDGLIIQIDKQVKDKREQINNERITSEKELRAIYINAIHEKLPDAIYLVKDNTKVLFSYLNDDEPFEEIKNSKNIFYYQADRYNNLYTKGSNISFADIEKYVNPKFSYDERSRLIQEKHDNKVDQIKKDIESLIKKRKEIELWNLKEIFQEVNIEEYLEDFLNNQMMRALLINGYINEDYEDYISLFHEGNITRTDEAFKRKIKSGIIIPFNYSLSEKVENLVKEIPDKYFKREIILNFDLLDYLSVNNGQYNSKYEDIISVLSNGKDNSINFIDEYIERGKNLPLFIKSICHSWSNWWNYVCENEKTFLYTDSKLRKYLKLIVKYADIEDILRMNKNNKLSKFISIMPDFIFFVDISYENKIISIIKELKIKFKQLDFSDRTTRSLFDYIYENNFYEINYENIHTLLTVYNDNINIQALKKSNYSTILNSGCQFLINYIEDNISIYVYDIFLKLEENTKETEDAISKLLNNDILNIKTKTDIILKQELQITDISVIQDNEIQQILIENNKIAVTWSNLYLYYETLEEESDLDEVLLNFLNQQRNYILLSKQTIKSELEGQSEEVINKFSLKFIDCNELQYDSYVNLLKSTPHPWNSLNFIHLDEDKVEWMVSNNFLTLTLDNFSNLKKYFPNEHIKLMGKQQNKLPSIFDDIELEEDDVLLLLKSGIVTNSNKIEIIKQIDDSFIIENNDIAKLTCNILADSDSIILTYDVIDSLLNSSSTKENKIKILNKNAEELTDSQLQSLTELLGWNYQNLFKKQHKPTFMDTEYNRNLFDHLKERGLIKRYEPCNKKDNELKVFANY